MSPIPVRMVNRWQGRPMLPHGQGRLYWHMLLHDHPEVHAVASDAHQRLAKIPGLDLVPHEWLHITTLIAGLTEEITDGQIDTMVAECRKMLAGTPPMTVTLGRVLYHPEAVVLQAQPGDTLTPILDATQAATRAATGHDGQLTHRPWVPHMTVAYSNSDQATDPILATLGRRLPGCDVTIRSVSLVVQDGPEYHWNWHPIAEISLDDGSENP